MNIFRRNKRSRKGFTLVEILIAVGIVAILTAIAIPSISAISRSLHQKQLDDYAQSVYLAAQDHLVSLRKSGTLTKFSDTETYPMVPSAENAGFPYAESIHKTDIAEEQVTEYSYITSFSSKLADVLPEGAIDSTVRNGYDYLIEYNRFTGDVYSVFLTDNEEIDLSEGYESLNALNGDEDLRENTRLRRKNYLGYYQGTIVRSGDHIASEGSLGTYLELTNGQEFMATVYIPVPESMRATIDTFKSSISSIILSATGSSSGKTLSFDILKDELLETDSILNTEDATTEILFRIPLQSLVDARNFGLESQGFIYGENISVTAKANSTAADIEASNLAEGNPWFNSYDSNNGTFYIANGRHLQNLRDLDGTELAANRVNVSSDINWTATREYYNSLNLKNLTFKPLDNEVFLKSAFIFDGAGKTISNLVIDDLGNNQGNTGLFRTYGAKASSLTLENPTVRGYQGAGNVGVFAGTAENAAELDGLKVAITQSGEYKSYNSAATWSGAIGKESVGLLVGLNKGTITNAQISSSLARGTDGTPAVGDSYGLVAGQNLGSGSISVSGVKAYLKGGSSSCLAGVAGQNLGEIEVIGNVELFVEDTMTPVFGGVAGKNAGKLFGEAKIVLSTDFRVGGTSLNGDIICGGVAGEMTGGSADGFVVSTYMNGSPKAMSAETDRGSIYMGGIAGRVTSGAIVSFGKNSLERASIYVPSASSEAFVGGLVGYAEAALSGATLTYTESSINAKASANAYVGGMVGNELYTLTNMQLNSAGSKPNTITATGTGFAYVGGLAGVLGQKLDGGILLSAESAPFSLDVYSGENFGHAYVGGLLGNGDYGTGRIENSMIRIDLPDQEIEEAKDATALTIYVKSQSAEVGGLVARANGGTIRNSEALGVEARLEAVSAYAGGAVGVVGDKGISLGGPDAENDSVTLSGYLNLVSGFGKSAKFAGGAVGKESEAGKKTYENVKTSVSLTGWGGSSVAAGTIYEDPSQRGVNVGQFIGYVANGSFKDCSSDSVSGSYQFLGKILCQATNSTSASYVMYEEPTQAQKDTMLTPFRTSTYNTEEKVAGYYGLQVADNFSDHIYRASLENCTYLSSSGVYEQIIQKSAVWRFEGAQDKGHYVFEPVGIDPKGLIKNGVLQGWDTTVDVLLYDVQNNVLMSSPTGQIGYRSGTLPVYGKPIENATAFENGVIYLQEGENLSDYRWTLGMADKYRVVDILDPTANRAFLMNNGGSYLVPYVNYSSRQGEVWFLDNDIDRELDPFNLIPDGYSQPEMLTLRETERGSNIYELTRRSRTILGMLAENWFDIDVTPRLDYNSQTGKYTVRWDRNPSQFQFLSYSYVGYDPNTSGFYFTYVGNSEDHICTNSKRA